MTQAARICVAKVGAAHGVRGEVRLWPFTEDPMSVIDYGPLSTKDGARQFEVVRARIAKDHLVAVIKGIATRQDAERINGLELYIDRDRLPETEDGEYYHADLIGLRALDPAGAEIGKVLAVHNFGAGDIIEIAPLQGATLLLPFTNEVVPTVDLSGGHVVIVRPQEIDGDSPKDADS
ncbi:16S rRNA processing protein RimM [Bradyrhizobiaceae bacterium SG-6C]|nr:16S rRNA processing protein RimM [Bradyrhizobiaceae bacterium SG-6C]